MKRLGHRVPSQLMKGGFRNWTQASVTPETAFLAPRLYSQRPCLYLKRDWFLKAVVTQEQKNRSWRSFVILQQSSRLLSDTRGQFQEQPIGLIKRTEVKSTPKTREPTFFYWVNWLFCRIQESSRSPSVLRPIRAQGSLTLHWVLRPCSILAADAPRLDWPWPKRGGRWDSWVGNICFLPMPSVSPSLIPTLPHSRT